MAVVRHALAGLAERLGMDEVSLADLKTVVTEACMNVVVHAYPDEAGPLEVEAEPLDDVMRIRIVDRGVGFQPRPDVDSPGSSLRIGLSLVATLSRNFTINGSSEGGTEVTIDLPLAHSGPPPHVHEDIEVEPAVKEVRISASDAA
ncbi:MAG TPA: ATP-binding protein, partial [Solirubrobacterales bacterium]|nr:ATP-binding protein [Solirubrobacterales bacterium]